MLGMKGSNFMAIKGKRVSKVLKAMITMCSVVGVSLFSNVSDVYAEKIIHTHIWATKYDDNKHWEYCTVCDEKRNSETHKYVDNWSYGSESCWHYNSSTRVCECGHSYVYKKDHEKLSDWINSPNRLVHFIKCYDCGTWTKSEACEDNEGKINCKNPGTCKKCKAVYTKDSHFINKAGKCRDCGLLLIEMSDPTVTYSADYLNATVEFKMISKHDSLKLTGSISANIDNKNYKSCKWTSTKINDKTYSYKGEFTLDPVIKTKMGVNLQNHSSAFKFNDTPITSVVNIKTAKVWYDHKAPVVTEIKQKDQTLHNTWATIKELTFTGTEEVSNVVKLSIKDATSGDVIVNNAKVDVKDSKYTYKCTPPLEGPEAGRKYIVIVTDEMDNTTQKEFIIYKTDCRAPLLRSEKEFTKWSQTKNITLKLTDYGSGTAYTSLENQTSYKSTVAVSDGYEAKYTFAEENYDVKEYKLYVKDGLGNAALETIKVGRVDNTKPTITQIKDDKNFEVTTTEIGAETPDNKPIGVILTISANDLNTVLNKEGSGVAGYAITKTKDSPNVEEWKEANEL